MDVAACVCVGARVKGGRRREGISFFFKELFSFFEIKTWPTQATFLQSVFQICPRGRCGRGRREERRGKKKKKKLKQSSTSSSRGNRKRLGERDSGARSDGTIKISLWQETDLRQRGPDRFC